jgi:hypothetical protein
MLQPRHSQPAPAGRRSSIVAGQDRTALEIDPIAVKPRTLALQHIDHAAEVRIHRPRDGVAGRFPFTDAVAAQSGPLGQAFARETHKHASGMELRTGNSNHRYGEIVCALAIAHNVNNFHQSRSRWAKIRAPS